MAAGSSAMSIDVALSSCRGASRDAFSLPQERGCAGNVALIFIVQDCPMVPSMDGAVENTNKLIRQYIPKGTNINTITDTLITKIQKKINRRPREKLNFSTPVKELYKHYS